MDVVVVGSLNQDISVVAERLPRPGESVTGSGHFLGPGGKGANQAVAAARLGAEAAMVGRVGRDEYGLSLVAGLEKEGIDVTAVGIDEESATGIAIITIDQNAENTIVVSPGANMELTEAHIQQHSDLIAGAEVVLVQLEVPTAAVLATARIANGVFCLNPAPARQLPEALLERVDILIPNRSELGTLADAEEPTDPEAAVDLARRLRHRGVTVVTMGAEGALVVEEDNITEVPAPNVEAVDPTGAGDAFCGALAQSLAQGGSLQESVRRAVAAGAVAVTRRGAQTAMPNRAEVDALIRGDTLR